VEFIDLGRQQVRIRPQIDAAISRVLEKGQYILGAEVAELEERLAAYAGVAHCITVANGTDALQVAMMALEIGPGDEVVVPGFSYIAVAEAAALLGARPVYCDIDPLTYNMDPRSIEAVVTARTKAIVPVSLYGQCADLPAINEVAGRLGIPVVEDAAQSFGASLGGRRSCSMSAIASTSFFPSKPLGCYGDGGALFTDDPTLAATMRRIARHGQERRYYHVQVGINSRLDTLQAAILLAKLEVFDDEISLRQEVADRYREMLGTNAEGLLLPHISPGNVSVYAQYTVRSVHRAALREALWRAGVPTVVHYDTPLNRQPAVADPAAVCPVGDMAVGQVFSLPMHPYLHAQEQRLIADAILRELERLKER
jgi:UDP-2-acetamido-2-deoxy-ribo-hexuluronate aminotransferase